MTSAIEPIEVEAEPARRRIRRVLWTASLIVFPLCLFVLCQPLVVRIQLLSHGWDVRSRDRHAGLPTWLPEFFHHPWLFGRVDAAHFSGKDFAASDIDRLYRFPQLQEVTVYGASISEDAFAAIARHKELAILRINSSRMDEAGLGRLSALPKLTKLELGKMSVGETAFQKIADCKSLEVLELNRVTINDDHLAALAALPRLREVRLDGSGTTDRGLEHLSHCANLIFLDIRHSTLSDTSLTVFSTHPKLQSLWLWECGNGDEHAKTLVGACPPSLTQLMLTGATTTDAALPHIAKLPKLRILSLWSVSITDDGLVPLASCLSLELLQLVKTPATPGGIGKLQRLNPKLGVTQQ